MSHINNNNNNMFIVERGFLPAVKLIVCNTSANTKAILFHMFVLYFFAFGKTIAISFVYITLNQRLERTNAFVF